MEAFLNKEYKLESSDNNFEPYLKALGVGFIARKVGSVVSSTVSLTKSDEAYTLSVSYTLKTLVTNFKPGVEVDLDTPDGRKFKSLFNFHGNTLSERQTDVKGIVTNIDRIFTADELKMVMSCGDVTSTRIFKSYI